MRKRTYKGILSGVIIASFVIGNKYATPMVTHADDVSVIKDDEAKYNIVVSENVKDGEFYESIYEKITLDENVESVGKYAFAKSKNLLELNLSDKIKNVSAGMCYQCDKLESINLSSVVGIGNSAFYECKNLSNVIFGDDLTAIGAKSFMNCNKLDNVNCPVNLEEIDDESFRNCKSLENITLNDGLKNIGKGTFEGCENLKNIKIPEGVTAIKDVTFKGCSNIVNVEIPSSVNTISTSAFADCGKNLHIIAEENSYAHEYATANGISFSEKCVVIEEPKEKISLKEADISLDETLYYYDGKKHTPEVTVSLDGEILVEGVDYSIVYTGDKAPGTWKAKVTGAGDYKGSKTGKYKIKVTPVKSFTLKNIKKKGVRIKANKLYKNRKITGYQIAYKLNKDAKFERIKIKNTGSLNNILTFLKKNKKYQIKVRCYVKRGGKNYYSAWSSEKTIKTKK